MRFTTLVLGILFTFGLLLNERDKLQLRTGN